MNESRRIVSDTGPLITLEQLQDGYGLLRRLYGKILIPPAVLNELSQGQFVSGTAYLDHFGVVDLLAVTSVERSHDVPGTDTLDVGEREAIRLALELKLPLLIEEATGRKAAQALGLHIS